MVFSASSIGLMEADMLPIVDLAKQGLAGIFGIVAMVWLSHRKLRFFERYGWFFLVGSLIPLVFVPFIGIEVNGNRNWLALGPIQFQPSELVKLTLIIWLGLRFASVYEDGKIRNMKEVFNKQTVSALLITFIFIGLGQDLGTMIIFGFIFLGMMIIAGVPKRIIIGTAIFAAVIATGMVMMSSSRSARILSTYRDCTGEDICLQVHQSLNAYMSGGLTGVGPGASRHKWSYLPEATTDFILPIFGEEFGIIGPLLVMLLILAMLYSMYVIMNRAVDSRAKIITGGVFCWIASQSLINIGATIKLVPVIGVPLPLVSYGMTSLISTFLAIGVVLSFARVQNMLPDYVSTPTRKAKRVIELTA
jgi:cell division protein FtsW